MITERQQLILETLVDEYIREAFPISSDFLKQQGGFDCSSATIRNDLMELAENGYLEKTHISGGRVPTDKGYRFFVNRLIEQGIKKEKKFSQEIDQVLLNIESAMEFSRQAARVLADFSHSFSLVGFNETGAFWREGLEYLTDSPEFQDIACWNSFLKAINQFERTIQQQKQEKEKAKSIEIYIGKESPICLNDFSFVVGEDKNRGVTLAIFGPKRMNFKKNINLISSLLNELDKI